MHFQLVRDLGKQQKSEVFLAKYFKSTYEPSKILSKLLHRFQKIITKIYCLHSQGRSLQSHENEKLKNKSNNKNHRRGLDLFYSRAKRLFFYVTDPTSARYYDIWKYS